MNTPTHFSVLTPLEFLKDVHNEASVAKKRVWAQAMEVEPGDHTDTLLEALKKAATNGLDVRLHVDNYSLLVTDGIFNYWPFVSADFRKERRLRRRNKQKMADELRIEGVQVVFTNPPTILDHLIPTRGRNHMKIVIIDDIAWIGGVNFHDSNFKSADVMVKIIDPAITAEITYIYELIHKQELKRDMRITCDEETSLLVDSGRINRSLILRHATELIKKSESNIKVITPLLPDADLLQALSYAIKQGKEVEIIAPNSTIMSGVYLLVDQFNEFMIRLRDIKLPIRYKNFMLHAKILIADDKTVIVGSHNFSSRGVRMGTEEVALLSTNKILLENISQFYDELAAK